MGELGDQFQFELDSGQDVTIGTGQLTFDLDPTLTVLDLLEQVVAQDSSDGSAQVRFSTDQADTYTVNVTAGAGSGQYTLLVATQDSETNGNGGNGDDTTAPVVSEVLVSSSAWTQAFRDGVDTSATGAGRGYVLSDAGVVSLPWSTLNQVHIVFSEDVVVDEANLRLVGVNTATYGVKAFAYDAATHTAVWTLDDMIGADRLHLLLDATTAPAVTDLSGNALGGDFGLDFDVLPGDVNGNGAVNAIDSAQARAQWNTLMGEVGYTVRADINGNGTINAIDSAQIRARWNVVLPAAEPLLASADALSFSPVFQANGSEDDALANQRRALMASAATPLSPAAWDDQHVGSFGTTATATSGLLKRYHAGSGFDVLLELEV